jgi:hypothetical protein
MYNDFFFYIQFPLLFFFLSSLFLLLLHCREEEEATALVSVRCVILD